MLDASGVAKTNKRGTDAVDMMAVETGEDVVEHRAFTKQLDVLERPPYAARGNNFGRKCGYLFISEDDRAGVWPDDPGDRVDERGFACAVWPDQAVNFARSTFMLTPRTAVTPPKLTETDSNLSRLMLDCPWRRAA